MSGNTENPGPGDTPPSSQQTETQALETPQGRYEKAVQDAIGVKWNDYARELAGSFNPGTVKIRFYVRRNRQVEDVKVLSNSSNKALASASLQSIMEANIPAIPEELLPLPSGEHMKFTISFNFTY